MKRASIMKIPNYRQVLICVLILIFSVNLWAEDDVRGKNRVSAAKNSTDRTSEPSNPKISETESTKAKNDLPARQGLNDAAPSEKTAGTKEEAPQTEQQTSAAPSPDTESSKIPSEAEYWVNRVDKFIEDLEQTEQAEINALYSELSTAFDRISGKLGKRLLGKRGGTKSYKDSPGTAETMPYLMPGTKEELYNTAYTLYHQRLRVLEYTSTEVLEDVTGTGVEGMEELYRELNFLKQILFYHIDALPQLMKDLVNDLRIAPLPVFGSLLQFVIAIAIFRYWRRWAPEGLLKLRRRLIKLRPRTKRTRRLTKLIWYFDQIRPPIAWLVLLSLVFSFVKDPELIFFIEVAKITANWVLISWGGVLFINALIARSSRSLKKETAALTLRSLKYIGTWFVFSGLNLGLISRYAGGGTLYAWVFSLNEILLALLLVVLLMMWRPKIIQGLESDSQKNFITEAVLRHRKGPISYLYCILAEFKCI